MHSQAILYCWVHHRYYKQCTNMYPSVLIIELRVIRGPSTDDRPPPLPLHTQATLPACQEPPPRLQRQQLSVPAPTPRQVHSCPGAPTQLAMQPVLLSDTLTLSLSLSLSLSLALSLCLSLSLSRTLSLSLFLSHSLSRQSRTTLPAPS